MSLINTSGAAAKNKCLQQELHFKETSLRACGSSGGNSIVARAKVGVLDAKVFRDISTGEV